MGVPFELLHFFFPQGNKKQDKSEERGECEMISLENELVNGKGESYQAVPRTP